MSWPAPPKAHIHESRVTLIRPHTPLEILASCHLVNKEARPILKRKMEHFRYQPIRYLVDWSAAWALIGPVGPLRKCLGVADRDISRRERAVRNFLDTCALYLSQTSRTQSGLRGVPAIEMTITHKSEVVYNNEVMETMGWLMELKHYIQARLVVIYKTPLPKLQVHGFYQRGDSSDFEKFVLQEIPREPEIVDETSLKSGVFVRPLEEEAFEKHVEGLKFY
ncbi:hypothetical protein M3J09_002904 [Ascochyta lentis]